MTSSGWTRQHRCEYRQTTVQEPWGATIPPKVSVANTVGFLKGKSAIRIHREYLGRQRNFTGYHFWARGYCVSTVGVAEEVIRDYIRKQEAGNRREETGETGTWLIEGPFEGPSSYRPLRGR